MAAVRRRAGTSATCRRAPSCTTGRQPLVLPGPPRRNGMTAAALARRDGDAMAPVDLSGWSLAVWALAAGRGPRWRWPCRRRPSRPRPAPARPRARPGRGGDAHRGRRHGAGALPALGLLARAWSPALVLRLAFRWTCTASALALSSLRSATGRRTAERRDPVAPLHRMWRTTRPMGWASGSAALASNAVPLIPRVRGVLAWVLCRAARRAENAGREGLMNRLWRNVTCHGRRLSSSW